MKYFIGIVLVIIIPLFYLYAFIPVFLVSLNGFDFYSKNLEYLYFVMIWIWKPFFIFWVIALINPRLVLWGNSTKRTRPRATFIYSSILYLSFLNLIAILDYEKVSKSIPKIIVGEIVDMLVLFWGPFLALLNCLFLILLPLGLISPQNFLWQGLGEATRKKAFLVYGSLFYLSYFGLYLCSPLMAGV